jgi:hypothetical protein
MDYFDNLMDKFDKTKPKVKGKTKKIKKKKTDTTQDSKKSKEWWEVDHKVKSYTKFAKPSKPKIKSTKPAKVISKRTETNTKKFNTPRQQNVPRVTQRQIEQKIDFESIRKLKDEKIKRMKKYRKKWMKETGGQGDFFKYFEMKMFERSQQKKKLVVENKNNKKIEINKKVSEKIQKINHPPKKPKIIQNNKNKIQSKSAQELYYEKMTRKLNRASSGPNHQDSDSDDSGYGLEDLEAEDLESYRLGQLEDELERKRNKLYN